MISVDVKRKTGEVRNFWNHIHFHPTDAIEDAWGQRILDTVARDGTAKTVRMYAMLEDAVSLDEKGGLRFDFSENDVRMDYLVSRGFDLFVSYNFIPPCLAADPSMTSSVNKGKTRYKGKVITISPPKDYDLFGECCRAFTEHIVRRYGEERVASWYLQCYNEPDNPSFFMPDLGKSDEDRLKREAEYLKLYRAFSSGVRSVSEKLRIGGPSCASSTVFLEAFLRHVREENLPLDFVGVHAYGTNWRSLNDGTKPFGVENNVEKLRRYDKIIRSVFPEGKPMIVDEWGASANGFFNVEECPHFLMREGSFLAAFFGKFVARTVKEAIPVEKMMICLSGQHEMTQDFSGFRNFFTLNFIPKPIYRAYWLLRLLRGRWLAAEWDDRDAEVLACGDENGERVMASYAAEHFDRALPEWRGSVTLRGVDTRRHVRVWCIDACHMNPYALSLRRGWREPFSEERLSQLRKEAEPVPAAQYDAAPAPDGTLTIPFSVSGAGLVLIETETCE